MARDLWVVVFAQNSTDGTSGFWVPNFLSNLLVGQSFAGWDFADDGVNFICEASFFIHFMLIFALA